MPLIDSTDRDNVATNPEGYDILVPVVDYGHLAARGNVNGLAWLQVERVAQGTTPYPVKAEGGQWSWPEVRGIRKHIKPPPSSNLLRIVGPMPSTWETITDHDVSARVALADAFSHDGAASDVLDRLTAAGYAIVKLDSTTEA